MKFEFKNLIAFTLSEMMIVLLIVSVISAATIPTITQQKQKPYNITQNDTTSAEIWKYDNFKGIYNFKDNRLFYEKETAIALTQTQSNETINELKLYRRGSETPKERGQIRFFHKNNNVGLVYLNNVPRVVLVGHEVAYNRNLLDNNIGIGYYAMAQDGDKDGYIVANSVAIGSYAMYRSLDARKNSAIGSYAQYYSNMSRSVAIGHCAGSDICEARYYYRRYPEASDPVNESNIAIGSRAGALGYASNGGKLISLNDNISIGFYSGYYFDYVGNRSDIKSNKISIGAYAGFGVPDADTISIGYNAGVRETPKDNRFFDNNISIGYYSGYNDGGTSDAGASNNNIFIGSYAGYLDLYHNSHSHVAIGAHSKIEYISYKTQTPSVAIGYYATAGRGHIALGAYAGYKGASHETSSIIIGRYALSQGSSIITGENNIYIGRRASYGNRGIKDESIFIGNEAGSAYNTSAGAGAKGLLIGYGAFSDSRHTRMILPYASKTIVSDTGGRASINAMNFASLIIGPGYGYPGGPSFNKTILVFNGSIYAKNSNFTPFTSDRRSKENIVKSKYGINQIRHINTYTYNYKSDKEKTLKVGVIAQEVQKYIPEAVSKTAGGYLCISFDWLLYPLANAIKDLDATLITMQKDLIVQSKDLILFEKRVDKLDKKVSKILEKQYKMQDKLNQVKYMVNMETK